MSRLGNHLTALQPLVCCPRCQSDLQINNAGFTCAQCQHNFSALGNLPCLLKDPEISKQHWRKQIWQIHRETEITREVFLSEMRRPGLIPATRQRLAEQIDLTDKVIAEFNQIILPLLGDPLPTDQPLASYQLLENFHYLFRDWGWPESNENQQAFDLLSQVFSQPVETLLVVASGASRLAYDIAAAKLAKKIITLDIDPLLLVMSEKICAGEICALTETRSNATELTQMSQVRQLQAPDGAITSIHPLLANGLSLPLKRESVDAVLIPWFSDLVGDFRQFINSVNSVLKPGGHWYHYGPLLYPTSVAASLRYSREEIFQLLAMAGYQIENCVSGSANFSHSPLTGRGRIEPVFAFAAKKTGESLCVDNLPDWLVLPYLSVADFPGRGNFQHANPAFEAIIKLIDGKRSLLDLTEAVRILIGGSPEGLIDSIRYCLSQCHPQCCAVIFDKPSFSAGA